MVCRKNDLAQNLTCQKKVIRNWLEGKDGHFKWKNIISIGLRDRSQLFWEVVAAWGDRLMLTERSCGSCVKWFMLVSALGELYWKSALDLVLSGYVGSC